jgi:Transposase IS4
MICHNVPTVENMRRLISKALLRRSPRRLASPLPAVDDHAALPSVAEEDEEGNGKSIVSNLFGQNSGSTADSAQELDDPVATVMADATDASAEANTTVTLAVDEPPQALTPSAAKKTSKPMASPEVPIFANFKGLEAGFLDGYDTDAEAGPNLGKEDAEEPPFELPVELSSNPLEEPDNQEATEPTFVFLSDEEILKMTVPKLKEQLTIRAVQYSSKLKRPELQERLRLAVSNGVKVSVFGNLSKKKDGRKKATITDMSGFAPGSHWVPLVPQELAAVEPNNALRNARAPTVPREEASTVPVKHNFADCFDRPLFQGRQYVPRYDASGNKVTDALEPQDLIVRKNLVARRKFQIRHHLSRHSDPVEFMDAFFPVTPNPYNPKFISQHQLTVFTNLKAQLANAGRGGTCYPDWSPFTVKDVRQFLGLYIWNGINPSPRIDMQLKPAAEDPVHGNQYLYENIGRNGVRRFREFRAFFAVQDPRAVPPCRKSNPLFKVSQVVKWINYIGPKSVDLGEAISIDEQTVGFQGRHADKRRITYKAEGDGFQCDVICQEGFTYQVYFRNEPAPVEYTSKGIAPLHARCLWLLDSLKEKYHRCWMDNLYLSAKFAKMCYNHRNAVLLSGVTRKQGRGLPTHVLQEEAKNKTAQMAVRGTVKAAVMVGDKDCPNLVAASVYDTKPVHFLSMVCESIKWIEKTKPVFDPIEKKKVDIKFLRLNMNDDYNSDMGHVDVADQLRGNYRMDHWQRQYKWWWSIWLWGFGVLIVNAYVYYKKVMEESGVPKKEWLSQYEFRQQIALAWIKFDECSIKQRKKTNLPTTVSVLTKRKVAPLDSGKPKRRKTLGDYSSVTTTPTTTTGTAVSMLTSDSESKKKRGSAFTDKSLLSVNGPFSRRLEPLLGHYCVQKEGRPKCALHRWAADLEQTSNVYACSYCGISLCVECFHLFHTLSSSELMEKKNELKGSMIAKKAAKKMDSEKKK